MKNIVVVGGGYAGVLCAKKLAKKFKKEIKSGDYSIKLIDKKPYNTMLTELHEVAANRVEEHSIKMSFDKIFAKRPIEFCLDEIQNIDYDQNKISGKVNDYKYDYLVLATGSKPTYFGTKGAKENTHTLWSYEDAVNLKHHILTSFRNAAKEMDPIKKKEYLTFCIIGGGFTGVEMAGELAEWVPFLCEEYGIARDEVNIHIGDMLDRLVVTFPEKLSTKTADRLLKMGVKVHTKTKVIEVEENKLIAEIDGKRIEYGSNTIIWTAGIEGSDLVDTIDEENKSRNRVVTNKYLQQEKYPNVFVAGDNISFIPEGSDLPVPQVVENAEHSASTISKNIVATEKGKELEEYKPAFHGLMLCIGGRYGIAHIGTEKKKWALPSFFAMFVKHFINVIYFIQVLGFNKVYSYAKAEILQVRDNRSFVGGHFSNYYPSFYLVPLRLFIAYKWISEGIPKLNKVLADFNNIFLFNLPTDAAASATEAATDWGEALPVPQFIENIVNWSMEHVIVYVAPEFQFIMVISEVIIGLMLLGGFLTPVAAAMSAAMCVMIYFSGMAPAEMIWFFTASIALIGIGGKGMAFSIDYYTMPILKKFGKKFSFTRKWYLYND